MSFTEAQIVEIRSVMDVYATAYRTKDFQAMMDIFSPDVCGFGSGPDEIIKDHEALARQFKRDMSQADINAVEFTETQIKGEGPVAWVMTLSAITFTVPGSEKQTINGRSLILRTLCEDADYFLYNISSLSQKLYSILSFDLLLN